MVVTRDALELWAAARTVAEHVTGSRCNRCEPDGCRLWERADRLLQRWEAAQGQRYPHYAPS